MTGRWLAVLGWLAQRLGLHEIKPSRTDLYRVLVLVSVCVVTSLMVVDYARAPTDSLVQGDPAPRTVKAPFTFQYADHLALERAREEAEAGVRPVYVHRADLVTELRERVGEAFSQARTTLGQRLEAAGGAVEPGTLDENARSGVVEVFRSELGVTVTAATGEALYTDAFSPSAEEALTQLLTEAMASLVLQDAQDLPRDGRGVRLLTLRQGELAPSVLEDVGTILSPNEARNRVQMAPLPPGLDPVVSNAVRAVGRALVRANLNYDAARSEEARRDARNAVPLQLRQVKRGATLFRAGDTITAEHIQIYEELRGQRGENELIWEVTAIALLLVLLLVALFSFGATYLANFSTRLRDVVAAGVLLVLTALMARGVVQVSEVAAATVGFDAEPGSVWYVVPVAGSVMLVRTLLGVGWTWLFAVSASVVCGLLMDLGVLPVIFFLVSGVVAGSAIEDTRERIGAIRSGVYVGMVNAITVLIIHFVQLMVTEAEATSAMAIRPFWSMSFGLAGGVLSGGMVLVLVPLFERAGFVTDFRLMELANMNHPLMRELMAKAPGSYHHSVNVGSLAEAGCSAIGANALRARVASYFHDVGKTVRPQYFVENQQDGVNRHDMLDAHASARIIISHVTDGGRMAREYNLPQPLVDNIYMHHGTSRINYFWRQAVERADDPSSVEEEEFRYPGPKPNTREAGVIMLADQVEAAARTLKVPDEKNLRDLVSFIINKTVADGQFSDCPLTLKDIHAVAEAFMPVLVGFYHHRVEYPDTKDISQAGASTSTRGAPNPRDAGMITLELAPSSPGEMDQAPTGSADELTNGAPANGVHSEHDLPSDAELASEIDEEPSDIIDYESLEHLMPKPGDDSP